MTTRPVSNTRRQRLAGQSSLASARAASYVSSQLQKRASASLMGVGPPSNGSRKANPGPAAAIAVPRGLGLGQVGPGRGVGR
ncbi:MAG TPA: hypothetical protein VH108_11775 [Gaiellaceae bacterium]|nr:hypothetical protein [Gaiellaceae bacterium]